MTTSRGLGIALGLALLPSAYLWAQGPPPQPPATPCASVSDVALVCGQQGPEDLYALPGARWVVASAMAGAGGIDAVRVSDHMSTRVYPSPDAKQQYDAKITQTDTGTRDQDQMRRQMTRERERATEQMQKPSTAPSTQPTN